MSRCLNIVNNEDDNKDDNGVYYKLTLTSQVSKNVA